LSMQTMNMLREWAQKTGRPFEELVQLLNQHMQNIQQAHPSMKPEVVERRARFLVYRELKAAMRYPGLQTFDCVFLGLNAAMDVFARRRAEALAAYEANPEDAVRRGLCRPDGTPIFRLPSGATIDISQPVLLRQTVGIGRPATGGALKWIVMIHRRADVNRLPPLKTPVRFSAIKRGEIDWRYSTTMTRITRFDPVQMQEFKSLDDTEICELLRTAPQQTRVTCNALSAWHATNQADRERICVLEGDSVFIRPEPTAVGNVLMIVEDETIMDLDAEGVTVWVHRDILDMINFGVGSRVLILGRTVSMPGWDRETRQIDRTVTRIGLNAFGIYADPVFRIAPEEEAVFEPDAVVGGE